MKSFRSLVVLRRPRPELWTIMRDHLVDFAGNIADIEQIRLLERTEERDDIVRIVNEWRVAQQIPKALGNLLNIGELCWIDRNVWDGRNWICSWSIEPRFLTGHIACAGQTSFVPAMADQGTRVIFEGQLELKPGVLGALARAETLLMGFLETVVTTIIPRNLRSVVEAAAAYEAKGALPPWNPRQGRSP